MIFALMGGEAPREVAIDEQGEAFAVRDGEEADLVVDAREVSPGCWSLLAGARSFEARVRREGTIYTVEMDGRAYTFDLSAPARAALRAGRGAAHGPGRIAAPMPGRILRILVQTGQQVQRGDPVAVVEAMKMENELTAPRDGVVAEILVTEGTTVEGGTDLVVIGDPAG